MSKKAAKDVAKIIEVLVNDVESYKNTRKNFEIDYQLLKKGILNESRFVLGKVILETLKEAIVQGDGIILDVKQNLCVDATTEENYSSPISDSVKDQLVVKRNKKVRKLLSSSEVKWEGNKKNKLDGKEGSIFDRVVEDERCVNIAEPYEKGVEASQLPHAGLNSMEDSSLESSKCHHFEVRESENRQENLENMDNQVKKMTTPSHETRDKVTKELLHAVEANPRKMDKVNGKEGKPEKKEHGLLPQGKENIEKKRRHVTDIEQHKRPLSSLFK